MQGVARFRAAPGRKRPRLKVLGIPTKGWVVAASLALMAGLATAVAPPVPKAAASAPPAPACSVCVLAPTGTSLAVTGKGNLDVTTVGVRVNSSSKPAVTITSNGSIISPEVGVVGTVSASGKGTVGNLTTGVQPAPDPFAAVTQPSVSATNPLPSEVLSSTQSATITPGIYQDIIISGRSSLTLQPGTYVVLHSLASSGQASLTARGVTIYLACSSYPTPCSSGQQGATLNLSGQGVLNLAAPVPACTPLAVFSDPANVSPLIISGNGIDTVSGGIYSRSGTLTLQGNGNVFRLHSQIATNHLTVTGNGTVSVTGLPPSCTLPAPYDGSHLTLSPSTAGPDTPHTSQALVANLTDKASNPLANQIITLTVTGANNTTLTAGTDKNGNAHFSYTGVNVGSDRGIATYTVGAGTVISNQATVTWAAPGSVSPVSVSPVTGNFFQESSTATAFTAKPGDTPAFAQTFPDIEFNPPAGTIPHDTSGITPTTRPFSDIATDVIGNFSSYTAAEGNGYQAGVGPMASFDAVLQGSFSVTKAGTQVFTLFRNDGYILGVGGGASGTAGNPNLNSPAGGTTPFDGYQVVAADNQVNGTTLGPDAITIDFPAAGTYPFEIDYLQRSPAASDPMTLALEIGTGTAGGLNLSLGYAYGNATSPNFPSPWQGNRGVNFVGNPPTASCTQSASTTGAVARVTPPASLLPGASSSTTQILAFPEQQNVVLSSPLSVDASAPGTSADWWSSTGSPGTIPASTSVDSFFLHADASQATNLGGTVTFNTPVLGVITSDGKLDQSDFLGSPGTTYETGIPNRGTENDTDTVSLSNNGHTVSVFFSFDSPADEARIITASTCQSWDSAALRFDNPTGSPVTLDHVTVDVGSTHFDPGFTNIVVPPHGTTVLTGTGQLTSGLQTGKGGIYITGHDPDYHGYLGANQIGAQDILKRAVSWVTYGKSTPRMLLVTDLHNPGGDQSDPRLGLTPAGFTYDVADDGSSGTALDLHTVNFSNYDVIVVASDYGGWLEQSELDILNARSSGLISFVNSGGGVVALAECGCRGNGTGTTHDRYGFLPTIVSSAALSQGESGYTLTSTGTAMGLTTSDINGNASHAIFTSTGGLSPVDYDPSGHIISLTERGLEVGQSNFDTTDAAETPGSSQSSGSGGSPVAGSVTLSQVATGFPSPIGIDYYQPTNEVVMSVNYSGGQPNNFDLVDSSGNFSQFSSVSGLSDEVYMSAIRASSCEAGFKPGDVYFGTGAGGVIARLSDNGTVLTNPWVTLPGEGGLLRGGVFQDVYCVAGGDLIVTTNNGDVWRVNAAGVATEVATGVGDTLEGPTTVPNDPRYGPWAGQILATSENCGCIQSIDPNTGAHTTWSVGSGNMDGNGVASAEAIHLVLPNENFFGVDYGSGTLRGAPASQFAGMAGDVVVATEFPGRLVDLTWNPTKNMFDTTDLLSTNASQWEGTAFAPAGLPGVPPVPSCIPATATPHINVTINGQTTTYSDAGKVLTDGGVDPDNCGGTDESQPWTPVGGAAAPVPPSTSLTLSPRLVPDQIVGNTLTVSAQAVDQTGQPESGQTVTLTVQGADNRTLSATTDVNGLASFSYTGTTFGLDSLTATTATGPPAVSNVVQVTWFDPEPSTPPPTSTSSGTSAPSVQILTPNTGEAVNAPVGVGAAVTVASGQTITSWTATWRPHGGATATTLATGSGYPPPTLATFDPTGFATGQYDITVSATSSGGGSGSATVTVSVNAPPPPPSPVMGAVGPADGTTLSAPTPVTGNCTAPSGQTITAWSVTLTPDAAGGTTRTLATGSGSPPATLTTFDPTLLPNGTYTLNVICDASGGGVGTTSTDVAVTGQLKLGRYTTTYQDLSVPVNGFQMALNRTYDSIDKTVGDFGVGWHVSVSNFQVASNRALGAGGWSQYDPTCFGALCLTAYKTSAPHFVTVTWPDGHQEQFDFTPTGGSSLFPSIGPAFTARPGSTSTLSTSEGIAGMTADGDLVDGSGHPYNPTQFTLTTASGNTLVLDTTKGLVSETDGNGNSLTIDSSGLHASNGESLTWTRDTSGRITDVNGASGQKLHYDYSTAGDLADFIDTAGAKTTFSYDSNHDLTGSAGPDSKPINTIKYGSDGRIQSITDASGNTVTVSTTVGSRQQVFTDQTGKLTTLETFDALGDILSSTETGGGQSLTSSWTYDPSGRPLTATDPLGYLRSYTYDTYGRLASETDANGFQTNLSYNTLGEPIVDLDPTGATTQGVTYTASGNPASMIEGGLYALNMAQNSAGKLTSFQAPGGTTLIGYDSNGHISSETDPAGTTTGVSADASGKLLSVTDALGHTQTYGYDAAGALNSVTTPAGTTTSVTDAYGRIVSETDALGNKITNTYYPTGQIKSATDQSGRTTSYTYDADGRVTSVSLPGGGGTDSYSYDAFGRLVTATNTAGNTVTMAYDGDGRMISETSSGPSQPTVTLHYTYDGDGNRTGISGPSGTTTYTYSSLGQPTGVVDPSGGHFAFTYNGAGQLTGMTRPNGVTDSVTYGADGNPANITSSFGATTVNQVSYTYDADGRQHTVTTAAGTTTFGYDAIGRLISATPSSGPAMAWSYDAAGNITARPGEPAGSLTYNAADQLTSSPGMTYAYDTSGDLIKATNTTNSTSTSYTWGAPGQLLGVSGPGGTTTMGYNPFGQRATLTTAAGTTASVYDFGNNLVAQYPPGGGTRSFVNGATLNDPLEVIQPGGAKDYYLADTQGNVDALTNSSGSAVQAYNYTPYGTQNSTGSTANSLTYGGQQFDASTGLYYDHARYYDPGTGRFLSPDPLGSSNPYGYAKDSPVNYSDPTGAQVELALMFQYIQNEANDLVGLVNGILNYASTCAAAELQPADSKPDIACSQGFLSASILYGELQAGGDNLIGLGFSNLTAYGVRALYDGAIAGSLQALDESVLPPGPSQIGCQTYNGFGNSLQSNLPSTVASGMGLTSDPLNLEAPTGYDVFGFVSGFLISALQLGQAAQTAITQGSCSWTGPLG